MLNPKSVASLQAALRDAGMDVEGYLFAS